MDINRVRSFLLLGGTNVITKGAWALAAILLIRYLGPAQFGILASLWALSGIVSGFTDLGTGQVILREGSRNGSLSRSLYRRALQLQVVVTLLALCVIGVFAYYLLPTPEIRGTDRTLLIATALAAPLIDRFQALFTVFSQLVDRYSVYSVLRSAYFTAVLVFFLLNIRNEGGLISFSVGYFAITLTFTLLMGLFTWRGLPGDYGSGIAPLGDTIRAGVPFLGIAGFSLIYGRAEVLLLGLVSATALAGAFHAIYLLVFLIFSGAGIFFTVITPRLYRHLDDRQALGDDYLDSIRWLSLLAWLVAPLLYLYSESMLRLVGGESLLDYVWLLQILLLIVLMLPFSAALDFLLPLTLLKERIRCDFVGIAITVLLSLAAIFWGRPDMVAVASVIGYGAAIGIGLIVIEKHVRLTIGQIAVEVLYVGFFAMVAAGITAWSQLDWLAGSILYAVSFVLFLAIVRYTAVTRLMKLIYRVVTQ